MLSREGSNTVKIMVLGARDSELRGGGVYIYMLLSYKSVNILKMVVMFSHKPHIFLMFIIRCID